MNLTGPQAMRCDALALDGGPGGHPEVSLNHAQYEFHASMPRNSGCQILQPLMNSGLHMLYKIRPDGSSVVSGQMLAASGM